MSDMQTIGLFDSETVQNIFYYALDRIEAEVGTSEISAEEVIDAVKYICVKVVEHDAQNMFG